MSCTTALASPSLPAPRTRATTTSSVARLRETAFAREHAHLGQTEKPLVTALLHLALTRAAQLRLAASLPTPPLCTVSRGRCRHAVGSWVNLPPAAG